jgi:NADH-quinone oxidoreductase subunit C
MREEYNNLKSLIEKNQKIKFTNLELIDDNLILSSFKEDLLFNIDFLKRSSDFKFRQLVDILGVDYPQREIRFEIIYLLLSHEKNLRISIKIPVGENDLVPSLTDIFPSANWQEREVFDMYGIKFSDHPDLRRILTDYEFEGYPLRKDFPLTGHKEVRYDTELQKVVYEPVKLAQDFRDFDFESPWEGSEYINKEQLKIDKEK